MGPDEREGGVNHPNDYRGDYSPSKMSIAKEVKPEQAISILQIKGSRPLDKT